MKFSVVAETRRKIKNTWQPAVQIQYTVKIPNYLSVNTDKMLSKLKGMIERNVPNEDTKIVSHQLYGDTAISIFEKNQLDYDKEVGKCVEINLNELNLDNGD